MFFGNVYFIIVKNWINYLDLIFAWFCYGWSRFVNIIIYKRVEYFISILLIFVYIMILGYLIYKKFDW